MNRLGRLFWKISPKKKISYLNRLGIDIVHGCQLRCIGCPNSTLRPNIQYMAVDDFDTILGNVDVTYLKNLRLFNFGEPLLHPNLLDILRRIPRQTYRIRTVTLLTNGQHHDFPVLTEVLRTGVVKELGVSCDGDGTKEDYERLRPPGKYERLTEFLIKTKELRDRYSPDVALFTVTISETPEGRKRWADLLAPMGWTPLFRQWYTLPGSLKTQIEQPAIVLNKGCRQLRRRYAYVDFDGTVVPCCFHPKPFELGNLKEQKYSDILNGPQRKFMLKELNANKENTAVCKSCPF